MDRESLIRRIGRFAPEAAFVLLLAGGLVTGGGAALAGLPRVLDAAMPGMAAQASADDGFAHGAARFTLAEGFSESRYAPQVLYPVATNPFPDWLTEAVRAVRSGSPPALRGMRTYQNGLPLRYLRPVIAICIDDLGEDIAGTDKAMALPKEVAMSFLPYAETTPFLAEAAARKGHPVLAHVPMQAVGPQDPGPMTLKVGMAADEIARRFGWDLSRVPGLIGINNHEGSRFTADAAGLAPVMATLKARHLFFFDSRTGPDSQVGRVAARMGVMSAERDIFLDDDQSAVSVSAQLEALAREAKRSGVAIAIGHPHDTTLRLLAAWLARDHGVTLVPLDEAIKLKAGRETALAAR
ncbi:MAG TPA: divergent polysaccharide deacetylase family protein [Rhizomicrobium sp.]